MKRTFFSLMAIVSLAMLSLSSCSDKADEYLSQPPEFTDMGFTSLATGDTVIHVGDPVVATALQSRKGKWLNRSDYTWRCEPVEVAHQYKKGAIYDNEPQNPTDTVTFTAKGVYKMVFSGKYRLSAGADYSKNYTIPIPNGKVTYRAPGLFYYEVEVEKTITVLP